MNKLVEETSPYLLQHADNPVEWYPWGEEALALAKAKNKPILLSIGYSACHWCHVMAHESFEDEETAVVMNELFINIKVDREERPDLDKLYQSSHQMLTQSSGGWPLTMFLTPDDQIPFFGGTYFPDKPRYQMPSFQQLMHKVVALFENRKDEIQKQNASLSDALGKLYSPQTAAIALDDSALTQARLELEQQFDSEQGGFGNAPKFPHTPNIERLMRDGLISDDKKALEIATFTLEKMGRGGVNDQLAGGFCRYSTDNEWMIPHFEKMLYDNGCLLAEYAQASALTSPANNSRLFERVSRETSAWVMREMQSDEGGYYSSLDADSEDENGHDHEGLFYVWTPEEVQQHLTEQEYAVFARRFGLDQKSNFEGKWHLYVYQTVAELAREFSRSEAEVVRLIDSAREKLHTVRDRRIWPGRDEKILTSWNALMIRGTAITARYLHLSEYEKSATRAVDFIRNALWQDGRLLATYKVDDKGHGKAHLMAYLDDYAYLIDALLELLQVRWRNQDLEWAIELADVLLDQFEDKDNGGFWFVADDHENLIQRPKSYTDEAIPNGNGVAAFALARLGYLVGDTRYLDAAERTLQNAAAGIKRMPSAHCTLLKALEEYLSAPQTIIVRGNTDQLAEMQKFVKTYSPRRQSYFIVNDQANLPTALADKKPAKDITMSSIAYLCEGMMCRSPITGNAITELLSST